MRGPTTADKNKVISEYMYPNEKAYPIAYDNDWNDLMEVVEKVEDMGYSVEIVNGSCTITKEGEGDQETWDFGLDKKNATYEALYKFICKV